MKLVFAYAAPAVKGVVFLRCRWALLGSLVVLNACPVAAATCIDPAAYTCTTQVVQRLDGLMLVDPAQGRAEQRLDGKPWIAPVWDPAPMAVTTTDTSVAAQTSLGQWGSFANQSLLLKYESIKTLAPDGFRLPKVAPRPDPNLDVWASVDARGLGVDTGREAASRVGADYRIGKQALVGMAVGLGDKSASAPGTEQSYTVATYFAFRPIKMLTLDTRAGFGESRAALVDRSGSDTHRFLMAQLRTDWMLGGLKFTPAVSVAHGEETARDSVDPATSNQVNAFAVSPRVSRPFDVGEGRKLEPFVSYEHKLEIGPTLGIDATGMRIDRKVGAGITLAKPRAYSLSVTTSLEEVGADPANVSGRLELKIPVR